LTSILNLVIGLTGVKENRGAHLSYMFHARADCLCFPLFLHAAAHPFALAHAAAHPRHRSRPFHATAVARSTCRRPEPSPPHAILAAVRPHRSASSAARVRRPPVSPERASAAMHHSVSPRRPHALRAAAPTRRAAHAAAPPRFLTTQPPPLRARKLFEGLSEPLFRTARAPRSSLRQWRWVARRGKGRK